MSFKRIVIAAGLILIIVAAVIFIVKQTGIATSGPKPPQWMLEQPTEKVDAVTGEVMTKQWQEWETLGQEQGAYKNPNSGRYTMVGLSTCLGCGAKVPGMKLQTGTTGQAPNGPMIWQSTETCPKCGKRML